MISTADAESIQLTNLCSLLTNVEREAALPESVTDALEKAVRTAGEDGSLSVEFTGTRTKRFADHPVRIDIGRIERIRAARQTPAPKLVASISGRLHHIKGIEQGQQTGLFSGEPISDQDLAAAQGITGPQGLDAIGIAQWSDAEEAYLAALTDG